MTRRKWLRGVAAAIALATMPERVVKAIPTQVPLPLDVEAWIVKEMGERMTKAVDAMVIHGTGWKDALKEARL